MSSVENPPSQNQLSRQSILQDPISNKSSMWSNDIMRVHQDVTNSYNHIKNLQSFQDQPRSVTSSVMDEQDPISRSSYNFLGPHRHLSSSTMSSQDNPMNGYSSSAFMSQKSSHIRDWPASTNSASSAFSNLQSGYSGLNFP